MVAVAAGAAGPAERLPAGGADRCLATSVASRSTTRCARPTSTPSRRCVALGREAGPGRARALREAGELLYDGPWVAERLTELESWIDAHPTSLLPVTATVLGDARDKTCGRCVPRVSSADRTWRASLAPIWDAVDAVVLPTVPTTPTVADTLADPHAMNTRMGRYTMSGNLLDLAGVAVPVGFTPRPACRPASGSTRRPARTALLAALGAGLHTARTLPAGATAYPVRVASASSGRR